MSILLDSAAAGTDVLQDTFALPAVNDAAGDVLLIAFLQNRPANDLSSTGWTQRENEVNNLATGGGIQYAMFDRFHAAPTGPYHDTFAASADCRWSAAQLAFRTTGTSVAHHGGNHANYGGGGASNPSLTAALGGTAAPGAVLVAYASFTTNGGAGQDIAWPAGWIELEEIESQATFIGLASVAYRIADGSETSVTPTILGSQISSMVVLIGEYEIDSSEGPPVSVGWDAYAAGDPNGPILATIQRDDGPVDGATERSVRVELNGPGQGSFKVNRYSPVALESVIARGNLVKCRFPWRDDYDAAFVLEKGDFTLAAQTEKGGEEFSFGGRGVLAYLARAVMDAVAYTTGLDVVNKLALVWQTKNVPRPTGIAFDPDEPDFVYVISATTRRVYKVRQSDRKVVSTSPALWSGADNYAGGLTRDPADSTIFWALEAPWGLGGAGHTKIRKVRRSDWAVLATYDLGSAVQLSDIRASSSNLYTTRYDTGKVQRRTKGSPGSVAEDWSVTYNGSTKTHPNGIAISENGAGSEIAMWFGGTSSGGVKRALIADLSDPSDVTRTINTSEAATFGGDWSLEGGSDYFYMVSYTLGITVKYQLTSASPHDPADGTWRLDEGSPGAILWRVIQEAQHPDRPQQPIPDLTYDFTSAVDSNGGAWDTHDGTTEFDAKVTEEVLSVALRLLPYGLVERMTPYLRLDAFNADSYGTNRTSTTFGAGKVRFVKGVNIIPELGRQERERPLHSHMLAVGKGGLYARATLADLGYVREGGVTTDLEDVTALEGTAEATLDDERVKSERIRFAVPIGDDPEAGRYLPFTHYDVGDLVTLHSGNGEHDFNNEAFVLYAFTLAESKAGTWEKAIVELGSATIADPATGSSGSGGGSGSGTGGGAGGGAGASGMSALTVEGMNDDGTTATSALGAKVRVWGAQVYQAGAGVIGMIVEGVTRLLALDDVDAEDITDGQGIAWDAASQTFKPVDLSAGSSSFVPTYLGPAEEFSVPDNRQALFALPIVLDAGAGIVIGDNAALVEV